MGKTVQRVSETKKSVPPIRAAVVGLGRAGWKIHVSTLRAMSDRFRLIAVVDPDSARREEAASTLSCAAHADLDAVLDDDSVELVVVASPSHLHTKQVLAAIGEGKHVVCEKPFALCLEDSDMMIDAAEAAGIVLAPFHNRRYELHYRKVLEVMGSGVLGEVLNVRICWHRFSRRWDWQAMRRYGGGALFNNGAHLIDQALEMFDDPEPEIFVDLRRGLSLGDAEEHMKLVLRPAKGPTLDIEFSNACAYEQDRWHVMGTGGGLRGTTDALEWRTVDWEQMPARQMEAGPAEGRLYPLESVPWHVRSWRHPPDAPSPYELLYSDVHSAIRSGTDLLVTPQCARRYVRLLDRCRTQFTEVL